MAAPAKFVTAGPGYGPPGPVPAYQWRKEFAKLLNLYKQEKPMSVLEIGTYEGGTLYHWLQHAPEGCHIVSLDSGIGGQDNSHLFVDWTPPGVVLTVLRMDSRAEATVETVRELGPFDFVFIDGDHFYDGVKDDWENYRPMVRSGGIVAFHDILPPSRTWPEIQVAWLWKEIRQFGWETHEIIADPDAEWGGLGWVRIP